MFKVSELGTLQQGQIETFAISFVSDLKPFLGDAVSMGPGLRDNLKRRVDVHFRLVEKGQGKVVIITIAVVD